MRKLFSLLLLFTLLFASLPASASEAPEMFTVTLTLIDLLELEGSLTRYLKVKLPEETAVLEVAEHCRFLDERKRTLFPFHFAERYRGKTITIDFIERGPDLYVVEECRGGTQ
jgi:hypothetical protein